MNYNLQKIKSKNLLRTFIVLILISLPFTGSDCEKTINEIGGTASLTGGWKLVYNAGSNHDICPGEIVIFDDNGSAKLQCPPNTNFIVRHYTVTNNELTYTETGVTYTIVNLTTNQLQLNGNNRILYYDKTAITDNNTGTAGNSDNFHSSEK